MNGESLQGLTHQQAIQTFKVECIFRMASAKQWYVSIKFGRNRMWKPWQFNRYFWQSIISWLYTKSVLTNSIFIFWQCCNVAMLFAIIWLKSIILKPHIPTATEKRSGDTDDSNSLAQSQPNAHSNSQPSQPLQFTQLQYQWGNACPHRAWRGWWQQRPWSWSKRLHHHGGHTWERLADGLHCCLESPSFLDTNEKISFALHS